MAQFGSSNYGIYFVSGLPLDVANPWLSIDLADYEGHMSAPSVGQLEVLSDLFEEVLRYCRPESVAVLGVAGGNGLDRIDTADTKRVVGVDIHPGYLEGPRTLC